MMKHFIFTSILISMISISVAQPSIQWQQSYGGLLKDGFTSGNVQQNQLAVTSDGGYIFTGFSHSNDGDVTGHHGLSSTQDCWVVKLDSLGYIEWQKSLGGTNDDFGYSVKQTSDGNYIVAGSTLSDDGDVTGYHPSSGGLSGDAWIVKLDAFGNIIWQSAFGGSGYDNASAIVEAGDGNYVFVGRTSSTDGDISGNNGSSDFLLMKLDQTTGAVIWQKCLGGSSSDVGYNLYNTSDNGFIISGNTNSTDGDVTGSAGTFLGSAWIVKTDSAGVIEWQNTFGGNSLEWGFDAQETIDGGYIIGLCTASSDLNGAHGNLDYYVAKLDNTGGIIWDQCYGGSDGDWFKSLTLTPDGGFLLIGSSSSIDGDIAGNIGQQDSWVVKLDSLGAIEWEKCYGGSEPDDGTSIAITPDGGFIIAVESNSNDVDVSGHHGALTESDIWIAKFGTYTTGIRDVTGPVSKIMVAPNPVHSNAVISFHLDKSSDVKIEITDITGGSIKTLANEKMQAGDHSFSWDAKVNNGIYFLSLLTENNSATYKINVLK